jgi:hypothetical protein
MWYPHTIDFNDQKSKRSRFSSTYIPQGKYAGIYDYKIYIYLPSNVWNRNDNFQKVQNERHATENHSDTIIFTFLDL